MSKTLVVLLLMLILLLSACRSPIIDKSIEATDTIGTVMNNEISEEYLLNFLEMTMNELKDKLEEYEEGTMAME